MNNDNSNPQGTNSAQQNAGVPNQNQPAEQVGTQSGNTDQTMGVESSTPGQMGQSNHGKSRNKKFNLSKLSKLPKKYLFGIIGFFVVLVILSLLMIMVGNGGSVADVLQNGNGQQDQVAPSPTPQGVPEKQADAELEEFRQKISDFEKNLRETNLRENSLRVPTLEWNISF